MGNQEDEDRRLAAEILGEQFQYPDMPGELIGLYDFYLKFKRAGFNEKQSLWLCADLIAGDHKNLNIEETEKPNE